MVDRITQAQFLALLQEATQNSASNLDTSWGPVNVIYDAVASVLASQNNVRLRQVYLLLSLLNEESFTDADIDGILYNEDISRPAGTQASITETFYRSQPLAAGEHVSIPIGFSMTTPGRSPTFVATEERGDSDLLFNSATNRYEVTVPMVALVKGEDGKVGPNRVTVPLRGLIGFDGATNTTAASGGEARYTNAQAIALYRMAVTSRQLSVPTGHKFYVMDSFPAVTDILEVFGTSTELERAEPGAVDVFVKGSSIESNSDSINYPGMGQVLAVSRPPLVGVSSVVSGVNTYVVDVDYEVVQDATGYQGSVRGVDGVRFLPTATTTLPDLGDPVVVTYTTNQLIRDLQSFEAAEDVAVEGRDLLYRQGVEVPINITATVTTRSGFTPATIRTLVQSTIVSYINALGLGAPVQISDIQGEVRSRISGVDNLVFSVLARDGGTTATDISLLSKEYPTTSTGLVTLTLG